MNYAFTVTLQAGYQLEGYITKPPKDHRIPYSDLFGFAKVGFFRRNVSAAFTHVFCIFNKFAVALKIVFQGTVFD